MLKDVGGTATQVRFRFLLFPGLLHTIFQMSPSSHGLAIYSIILTVVILAIAVFLYIL
jgi:hypothetical protein